MKARCSNPNNTHFKYYGGKGIKVCERWMTFDNFFADMGESPTNATIERLNSNGDYEPCNCVWATRAEQLRNTSRTVNITFNGITQCRTDWAKQLGITSMTIRDRLSRGWSVEKTLSIPASTKYAKKT